MSAVIVQFPRQVHAGAVADAAKPRQGVNEAMVCEIKALARQLWPGEFDAKPELMLIQGGRAQ